jgi:SagB-type dehydrogenase family enzyme
VTDPWTTHQLDDQYPAAMLYHENSSLNRSRGPILGERIATFTEQSMALGGHPASTEKQYPLCPQYALPRPRTSSAIERLIARRRTRRDFSGRGVDLRQLSRVLQSAYGVTAPPADRPAMPARRACPSAGALFPLEVYPVVHRSPDVSPGVYHYRAGGHCVEQLREGDVRQKLEANLMGIDLMPGADMAIVITSVFERTMVKYGERGYRFILIEVGHLAQNVCLACEAMKLNSVCLGGVHEEGVGSLLSIDRRAEAVQYVILIGTR